MEYMTLRFVGLGFVELGEGAFPAHAPFRTRPYFFRRAAEARAGFEINKTVFRGGAGGPRLDSEPPSDVNYAAAFDARYHSKLIKSLGPIVPSGRILLSAGGRRRRRLHSNNGLSSRALITQLPWRTRPRSIADLGA
ncbi:hypothetical protein EVAR_83854_1 [Eumeta japonica]|uniref:Uncharacterized protein n=1 Tax=Eumeta variegata TaxID=151549 RepID=A0A4C1UR76_EUMVA|nr:hypothetical protein EVAR_83854_1 [Eumeta japonica]